MAIKKTHLLIVFSFVFTMAIGMIFLSATSLSVASTDVVADEVTEEKEIIPEAIVEPKESISLQVGDILLVRDNGDFFSLLIPGPWKHSMVYVGNGKVVEACEYGVITSSVSKFYGKADVYRVSTSSSIKQAAVNFANSKLGCGYDVIWLTYIGGKQVNGINYYCSELCWAAYKAQGVDIDQNPGWNWSYGYNVCSCEIAWDSQTYMVGTY